MKNSRLLKSVLLSTAICLVNAPFIFSQENKEAKKEKSYPVESYQEMNNPKQTNPELWAKLKNISYGWGTIDIRYKKEEPANAGSLKKQASLKGWKGERVASQIVVSTPKDVNLRYEISDLKLNGSSSNIIGAEDMLTGFVRYVMSDELNLDGTGGCGYRPDPEKFNYHLEADPIDNITKNLKVDSNSSQAVWIGVNIPSSAKAGTYKGSVTLYDGESKIGTLPLSVNVINRTLPAPADWKFHLDLWQNPYATARYYGVEPFSDEHFSKMKADMEHYANAGGKSITVSLMHKPWNGQTYDPFESMVTWMKKADGSWMYDFTTFDKWVEFMMSVGVTKSINCYSMVPWALSFQYFDQASNSFKYLKSKPGEKEYDIFWGSMLTAFAKHLKEKGWFEITHIAMDERPMDAMLAAKKVIKNADPNFKMSLAGTLFEELVDELDDYCVALVHQFPQDEIIKRREEGKVTTFYTCCAEGRPNTFTFSEPAEAAWLAGYAANADFDGYLRWAYNSWVEQPLLDSRFITWASGDTYMVYPGGRSSIRFERLREGIQNFEKYQILKGEFTQKNNKSSLKKLTNSVKEFDVKKLGDGAAAPAVNQFETVLNTL
ncbi:MAG: DUF6067 family protein [Bacteroidales bacterium]|nr:DUF6067 family protein [Bacteroidales bacterium]